MPRASLRSVLLICAFSTACMCRVSTQTAGNSASARALSSHCDSGPASNPIRLKWAGREEKKPVSYRPRNEDNEIEVLVSYIKADEEPPLRWLTSKKSST